MSDQLNQEAVTTIDESTLDPAVIEYFTKKFEPVIKKKDELLADVSTLKGLKKELDALGGLDTIKGLRQQADAAAAAAERDRLEKLSKEGKLTEVEEHYKKLLAEKDTKLTSYQQKVVTKEVDARLAEAIREAEGSPMLLMHALRGRVEATMDEDGEVQIVVKGAAGQTLGDDGKPLTLKSLVAEFRNDADFAPAFKAHQASGAGGRKSSGTTAVNPFAKASQNVTEQMKLIKSSPEVARKLALEAGVEADW